MVTNTAATRVAGTLKKRIAIDITVALSIGTVSAYAWWHMYHNKKTQERDAWYDNYAKTRSEE